MEMVNAIYDYGKCQYQCGNYSGASDLLYHYRILVRSTHRTQRQLRRADIPTSWSSLRTMRRLPRPVGESLPVRFCL